MNNNNLCSMGFDCNQMGIRDNGWCINAESCYSWAEAWDLPLQTFLQSEENGTQYYYRVVVIGSNYFAAPIERNLEAIVGRNWRDYFAEYGYVEAEFVYPPLDTL